MPGLQRDNLPYLAAGLESSLQIGGRVAAPESDGGYAELVEDVFPGVGHVASEDSGTNCNSEFVVVLGLEESYIDFGAGGPGDEPELAEWHSSFLCSIGKWPPPLLHVPPR